MLQALPSLWIRKWSCDAERGRNEGAWSQSESESEKVIDGDPQKVSWGEDHLWEENMGLDN